MVRHAYRPLLIFILALAAYGVLASRTIFFRHSTTPYPVALADSFLHGRTDLLDPPSEGYDLIFYHDRWYVAQGPLPSLLIMPLVALLGPAQVSDIVVDILVGALNVMLCDMVLGVTAPGLSRRRRSLLTLFFALGTVHAWLSILGTVWFLGQISTVMFCWGLIYAVWKWKPILSGIMLGFILLGRPSIVPGAVLLAVGWWAITGGETPAVLARQVVKLALPLTVAVALLGAYNAVRFGNPADFGYAYLNDAANIRLRRQTYGSFNLVFLPENFYIFTIKPPQIQLDLANLRATSVSPDPDGMGFLWMSPGLLYALVVFPQTRSEQWQYGWVLLAVAAILLPSLLYHNTGSAQFGYRFILDALPFWMILVAWGAKRGSIYVLAGLVLFSVAVSVWGTRWFYRFWYKLL